MNNVLPRKPKFPVEGTLYDEPGPNAEAVLEYLIATILDIMPDEGLNPEHSKMMLEAARMERECRNGRHPANELNERRDEVLLVIDNLICLYNHLAKSVPNATSITVIDGHPRGRNLWFTKDQS